MKTYIRHWSTHLSRYQRAEADLGFHPTAKIFWPVGQ